MADGSLSVSPASGPASGPDSVSGDAAPLIAFRNVSLWFGSTPALLDVSFHVRRGETKVLLGEAGAGKTVILKLAIGLLRPGSGSVCVLNEPVSSLPEAKLFELRQQIGMVFQESALFDSLTVGENVAYPLEEQGGLSDGAIGERVAECLRAVELEAAIDKYPPEISGGMQRRVAIARALATKPEIMLYDSPTAGLDPVTAANIMQLIVRLRDLRQVTSLMVTHRLQDGFLLAANRWDPDHQQLEPDPTAGDRTSFLLLHRQRPVFDGSAKDLFASPDEYTRRFLHQSSQAPNGGLPPARQQPPA